MLFWDVLRSSAGISTCWLIWYHQTRHVGKSLSVKAVTISFSDLTSAWFSSLIAPSPVRAKAAALISSWIYTLSFSYFSFFILYEELKGRRGRSKVLIKAEPVFTSIDFMWFYHSDQITVVNPRKYYRRSQSFSCKWHPTQRLCQSPCRVPQSAPPPKNSLIIAADKSWVCVLTIILDFQNHKHCASPWK